MAKKTEESAQITLMQRIKETIPSNVSLVDELADLLQMSNDSAYRRMRGETQLSIEEIALICKHFKISFDAFINNADSHSVSFSCHPLSENVSTFKDYLLTIKADLEKVCQFPENDRSIIFAAEDIPVFQHFAHPFLTAFKIFYWNKSILNAKGYEDSKFETAHIDKDLLKIAASIYDSYSKISSIEIWSDDTINSTVKQIEFYWEAGFFKTKKDALLVMEEFNLMFIRINKQAELNVKLDIDNKPVSRENNYQLYHSDIMIGTNCVLASMGNNKAAYISYHSFNSMVTSNASFCNETEFWLRNLIRKSNLISGVAEKQRYRYFKMISEQMKKLREKIESD